MRQVADTATGEILEVLDADLVGSEPYDYASFRRMSTTVSREHRATIAETEQTGEALAAAEADYHKQLAVVVARLKVVHGATIAETLAKGEDRVKEAKEARDIAAAKDRAAMERVRLCRADRDAAQAMGYWSREADSDGWSK
jgi:hypothetical protein